MGLSSSKTTTGPSNYAKPYVTSAGNTLQPGYDAATANNATLMPRVNSALDYSQGVMSGKYLNGNPYLQKVLDSTNADVTNGVSSQFEGAGRYGSADYGGVLAKAIADNENKLRYGDYAQERAYQNAAPGQLAGLAGVSSALPQAPGTTYAEAVHNLLGGYETSKTSPNMGEMYLKAAAAAAQAAAMASDRRLKTNIELERRDPDGLGWYSWNWKADPSGPKVRGVIADEVQKLRPQAYIPNFIGEYAGVNYGAL